MRVVAAGLALCFGLAATTLTPTPTHACDGLLVYAGAGFRGPIEEAAARFEAREGVPIDATFAGSGCLLAQAELAGRGDVFLPGELHYLRNAADRGLTESSTCLAYLRPVIAVRRGNPLGIKGPEDLAREGLRVGLGDQEAVAVGLAAERWLRASLGSPLYDALQTNCVTRALNVNELGTQLTLGALDAVVVWDATVPLFPGLEAVVSESSAEFRTVISGATLSMSDWPDESGRFLAFLASDEGRAIFREHGYEPIGGPCLGDEFDALPTSSTTTNDNAHE